MKKYITVLLILSGCRNWGDSSMSRNGQADTSFAAIVAGDMHWSSATEIASAHHDMHTMNVLPSIKDPLGPVQQHHEAMPKIEVAPNGDMYSAYVVTRQVPGKKWPESALRFIRSIDGGKTWSTPISVTDNGDFGSHNFHSMYVGKDGVIYISWLDGRLGKAAAYMTHSSDGGHTWAKNSQLDAEPACPCCRTAVVADQKGKLYVAWRKVFPGNIRDIVLSSSTDSGKTWTTPVPVHKDNWVYDGCPHAGPSLAVDANGTVHVTWWTGRPAAPGVYYTVSRSGGQSFDTPILISSVKRPTYPPLVVKSDSIFITWQESGKTLSKVGTKS